MLTTFNCYNYVLCDAPVTDGLANNQFFKNLGFQDPASPLMEGLIGLHSDVWAVMLFVAGFVSFSLVATLYSSPSKSFKIHHHNLIEIIWTSVPAVILCFIAIPSFTLLYGVDEIFQPSLTLKAISRQWYWTYEYGDYESNSGELVDNTLVFDSNLLPDDELEQGQLRLLDVDNRVVVPVNKPIRLLTSSGDVIHGRRCALISLETLWRNEGPDFYGNRFSGTWLSFYYKCPNEFRPLLFIIYNKKWGLCPNEFRPLLFIIYNKKWGLCPNEFPWGKKGVGLRARQEVVLNMVRFTKLFYNPRRKVINIYREHKQCSFLQYASYRCEWFGAFAYVSSFKRLQRPNFDAQLCNLRSYVVRANENKGTSKVLGKKSKKMLSKSGDRVTDLVVWKPFTSLVCEAPQPYKFLNFAFRALGKIDNFDINKFNAYKLAVCLAKIEIYSILALRNKDYLGMVHLIDIIGDSSFLLYCYSLIKKTKGTVGIDHVLPTGITERGILKLSSELREGKYRPKPTKRAMIPKADKSKVRPLGIASTKDKIVQKALKLVLEPLFEPIFMDTSYGFRPFRSCHKALSHIEFHWPNTTWFLEFDFPQAFHKINHRVLISQLCGRFRDPKINKVIWHMLKAEYIHLKGLVDSKLTLSEKTPQGSILSPLLCNIYLHQLDKFIMEELVPKYSANPNLRKRKVSSDANQQLRVLEAQKNNIPVDKFRLTYVRYADHFLLGFIGAKSTAKIILAEILWFCELELKIGINPDKSGIRHKSQGVMFLGYKVWLDENNTVSSSRPWRSLRTRLMFSVPVAKLFKKYADKGFFMKARKGERDKYVARRQDKWLFLKPFFIIQRFNSVVRGLINYYSGSERLSDIYQVIYCLRRSAALTLAHHKKRLSASWAFKIWGPNLKVELPILSIGQDKVKTIEFLFPSLREHKSRWGSLNMDEVSREIIAGSSLALGRAMTLVNSAEELQCSIPNCNNQASDWHHIRHRIKLKLAGSNSKNSFSEVHARKIPVCKKHHREIHTGKYHGVNLKKISGYEI
jgi:group II intron reverse transcriptase/maturase